MKFKCAKADMHRVLQIVSRALPTNTPMLDLMSFLFEVDIHKVQISATNLKTYIASDLPIEADQKFEFIVQGSVLLETMQALNSLEGESVFFERLHTGQLSLHLDKGANFTLYVRDVLEYPKTALLQPKINFNMSGADLRQLFRSGYIASLQSDESTLGYKGTCVDLKDGFMVIISFDGNRISKVSKRISGLAAEVQQRWFLSLESSAELLKILPDTDVEICSSETQLLLRFGNTAFQTPLNQTDRLDNIWDYLPEEEPKHVLVDVHDFSTHLKVLSPIAREVDNRIFFAIEDKNIKLRAFSDRRGEATVEFSVDCPADFKASVGLNGKFISDYLNSTEAKTICFSIENSDCPAYLWASDNDTDKTDIYIVSSLSIVG